QKKETIVSIAGYEPFLVTSDDFEAGTFEDAPWVIQADEPKKSGEEKVFLESIIREPFLTVTERRSYLGWDDKKFGKMVNSLLAKKRVERVKVKLGRGSPRILYQKPGTIPSIRHEFYVNWISDKLRQKGYVVSTTKDGPDIIVKDANTAIEVELGKSNVAGNIRRNTKEYRKTVVA
ncbi:MAG: hypothetical protein GWN86_06815, partial [Desulfobacterales bacterium]|nr:hypothetical protein [Desulfobacterales bacterium]